MNSVQVMVSVRRERLRQELREQILTAARDLFVKEGYASVSMRRIAETVGCAPGTIYLHFADKNEILTAICIETFAKLDKRMEAILADPCDPLERLRRGGRTYIQFGIDHADHYLVTFTMSASVADEAQQAREAGHRSFECLRSSVARCVEAGLLRVPDAEQVAQSLWAAMHGLVMLLIGKPGFPFVEQTRLIEGVLDMAIEGIRKR